MKILVLSQYFWPENFRINDLVLEWKKKNYEVEVLTGFPNYPSGKVFRDFKKDKNNFKFYEDVKIYRVPVITRGDGSKIRIFLNYLSFFINSLFFSLFKLRKKKYDVIFTFGTSPVTVSLIGIFLSKFTNSKNVLWLLDLWPHILDELSIIKYKSLIFKVIDRVMKFIYENNDLILAQSKPFKKILTEDYKKIKKIDLLMSWPEKVKLTTNISDDIKFLPDYLNIVFTGAIGDAQNFDEILTVFKLLINKKIRFIIVGDGRKKKWLEKYIKVEKINNIILVGNKPLNKIPEYIAHADILFFSLKAGKFGSATIPGKLSTYLNYNKPILCHADGISNKIIKENNFGLVSVPRDINQLKKNIEKLFHFKKKGNLDKIFNNSLNYIEFDFKKSFNNLCNLLTALKLDKDNMKFRLITDIKKIPFGQNFILSGFNLAYLGYLKSRVINVSSKTYLWPDGIFVKRFFKKKKIDKIPGRKLIDSLTIPKKKDTIHVIGNLQEKSKKYLEKKFKLKIKHTPLPNSDVEDLKLMLPKIRQNELIFLTLPTPKQEILAEELSLNNDKFSIFCIGGALNMLGGYEPIPPSFMENYLEFIWRFRFDTRRRLKRFFITLLYYLYGEISFEYKKYKEEIL